MKVDKGMGKGGNPRVEDGKAGSGLSTSGSSIVSTICLGDFGRIGGCREGPGSAMMSAGKRNCWRGRSRE